MPRIFEDRLLHCPENYPLSAQVIALAEKEDKAAFDLAATNRAGPEAFMSLLCDVYEANEEKIVDAMLDWVKARVADLNVDEEDAIKSEEEESSEESKSEEEVHDESPAWVTGWVNAIEHDTMLQDGALFDGKIVRRADEELDVFVDYLPRLDDGTLRTPMGAEYDRGLFYDLNGLPEDDSYVTYPAPSLFDFLDHHNSSLAPCAGPTPETKRPGLESFAYLWGQPALEEHEEALARTSAVVPPVAHEHDCVRHLLIHPTIWVPSAFEKQAWASHAEAQVKAPYYHGRDEKDAVDGDYNDDETNSSSSEDDFAEANADVFDFDLYAYVREDRLPHTLGV